VVLTASETYRSARRHDCQRSAFPRVDTTSPITYANSPIPWGACPYSLPSPAAPFRRPRSPDIARNRSTLDVRLSSVEALTALSLSKGSQSSSELGRRTFTPTYDNWLTEHLHPYPERTGLAVCGTSG
jgi:hypothetical protein